MERRIKLLLEELGELLRDVISDSPAAVEKVDAIQEEGYAIHLLLDCKPAGDDLEDEDLLDVEDLRSEDTGVSNEPTSTDETDEIRSNPPSASFQINAADLHFLKSVGIDPTRRANRRRYRPSSESPQGGD